MIELNGVEQLRSPVAIIAFEGWNDAADAASDIVEHLETAFDARPVGTLDPDDYYDFQVNRPLVSMNDDNTRSLTWPSTRLGLAEFSPERQVVLVHGVEPNMRWRGFCSEIIDALQRMQVTRVVLLGALLADSPHTRPVPVTGIASDPVLAARLRLEPSRYEGPTGIVGVLQDACAAAGLEAISLWAAVPHYVAQPPCPKASLALLRRLEDMLDLTIPLGELPERALAWEKTVNELASEDSEVAEYVQALEAREPEQGLREMSGEEIAADVERFLRRQGD